MRLLFTAIICSIFLAGPALAGDLSLNIEGIKDSTGSVIGAVYVDKATFMDHAKAYRVFKTTAAPGEVKYTVHDLPAGRYAITICHDTNNNGKMDKNFLGVPLEGFGFSNNPEVTITTGPPTFEQTVFSYDGQNQAVSIKTTYVKF